MGKRIKPRLRLDLPPVVWVAWKEMHLHGPCIWACWTCRKTAKTSGPKAHIPMCPTCREPMRNMGSRWRPGRRGRWLTQAQVQLLAMQRGQRR